MYFKKIFALSILWITSFSFAVAGNPITPEDASEGVEDYCDHSEFEALFNVSGFDLITRAKDFLGTPYRYGASSPSGFDCSGFTSYIYKCLSVNKAEIQVGDLVFFGSRKHNIGHVGIVCEVRDDGNFKFIHSSCKYGVTISNSEEGYYAHRYRGARRILEG